MSSAPMSQKDAAELPRHPLTVAAGPELRRRIRGSGLALDAAQQAAVAALARPAAHGYYLWGPVGRGKTVLAGHYLAALAGIPTRRFHFHEFFRQLQRQIFGTGASLTAAIAASVGPARAVMFDEFHVHDVADAVYLTAVLRWLRDHDVLLIATSNYAPGELLPDPLHHHRFLPAIGLIESGLTVVPLGAGVDYRHAADTATGFAAGTWHIAETVTTPDADGVALDPDGVALRAAAVDGDAAVFTFEELCERPLAAQQYLWLADRFRSVSVLGVPDPAGIRREPLHRFSILVDILHDRDATLHVSASGAPERMRDAAHPPRDVARAVSRLAILRRL